ncbi:hypothetical protein LMG26857_00074 [Achromobacter anxifer]|jgi:hypothetical protein|nr:hypothetical protein LMG26857_00074 [Achromobacter anxifer]
MNPVRLIPDASLALAWLVDRADAHEALMARHLLETAHESENTVPPHLAYGSRERHVARRT